MGKETGIEYDYDEYTIDLTDYEDDVCADIDIGSSYYYDDTISTSHMASSIGNISLGGGGASGIYTVTGTGGANWIDTSVNSTMNVHGDVVINEEGDLKIGDRSLKEFMSKMEDRLAILVPDPAKLEKFEALKKAYDHYKMMEKLCEIENKDEEK